MDIFKFTNPNEPLLMEYGKIINGISSKMWIERYQDAGEFEIIAPVDSGVKEELTIGSFISHTNTREIMIVENHEISEDAGKATEVKITGRSFETFLENRMVGSNQTFPIVGETPRPDYAMSSGYLHNQAALLINQHLQSGSLLDDNDALSNVIAWVDITAAEYTAQEARNIKFGSLYDRVLELLKIGNLGIRTVRPGPGEALAGSGYVTIFIYYNGTVRPPSVIFSPRSGAVLNADYLWSDKSLKNAALVTSKWLETRVVGSEAEYDRRWMMIDASFIDDYLDYEPTGALLTSLVSSLQTLGTTMLQNQKTTFIVRPQIAPASIRPKYRVDFELGDRVYVGTDFHQVSPMQVREYVEIEDENGESDYPTFS